MKMFTQKFMIVFLIMLSIGLIVFYPHLFKSIQNKPRDVILEKFELYIDSSVNNYMLCPDVKNIKIQSSFKKAFSYYSQQSDIKSQYLTGIAYSSGIGVDPDSQKSLDRLRKLALQGYLPAQVGYANLLISGRRGENKPLGQLDAKTLYWLESAAAERNPSARIVLAMYYFMLERFPEAMILFENIAKQESDPSSAMAQYELGEFYANAIGVARDDVKALYWYKKSINHKLVPLTAGLAMMSISHIYEKPGSLHDAKKSAYWLEQVNKLQEWFDRCRGADLENLSADDLNYSILLVK
jgi:TPR repeat protein